MVARGAAIFGAGKGGRTQFMYDGDDKEVLNVSAVDVLPGRVLLADHGEDKQLRYTPVSRVDGGLGSALPACLADSHPNRTPTQVLEQFAPPGTKHRWLNIAQVDPSLVFCLKMDTGYAAASDIFNAPFGVRLPNAILGKPFMGEFEYLVRPHLDRIVPALWAVIHLLILSSYSHRATARSPSRSTPSAATRAART